MIKSVALVDIRENPVALRAVDRTAEEFLGLVLSIKTKGFIGAISVREQTNPETGKKVYEIVDGLHRYAAAIEAGLSEISVDVLEMSQFQVLETQILMNVQRIDTKPMEYSKGLLRLLAMNPLMTEAELASKVGKSPAWIGERLSLNRISNDEIKKLVNDGKIGLANAYALAKLPADEMTDWVDRAMSQSPEEFLPAIQARTKEIRNARLQGREASTAEFVPVAFMQKLSELKGALENQDLLNRLTSGCESVSDGVRRGIEFALHLDPLSVAAQKAKDDERKAKLEAEVLRRKEEKAKKVADKAAKAAAEAQAAQDALQALKM
jgi:ParB/RepB/Spo0J family partition protein